MTVCAHVVIPVKQLTSVGVIFEVVTDIVEVLLRHEALVVPMTGKSFVVLSHQLRVVLVSVYCLAEVDKY